MNNLTQMVETLAAFEPWRGDCPDGYFPNFLGVMTDLEFVERHHPSNVERDDLDKIAVPTVEDGETFFEFAAIHQAVTEARDRFVMVELGGGYAARSVDAHHLLQRINPMPSQLVVVEAEPTHYEWAVRHFRANDIDPFDHWLLKAAVWESGDPVLFMRGAGLYYNSIVDASQIEMAITDVINMDGADRVVRNILESGRCGVKIGYDSIAGEDYFDYGFVSTVPLSGILAPLPAVDLLDLDIQGAEGPVLIAAIEALNRKVKRVYIGTHNTEAHKSLWNLFIANGWRGELNYLPETKHETAWGAFETMDGVMYLHNPRLS